MPSWQAPLALLACVLLVCTPSGAPPVSWLAAQPQGCAACTCADCHCCVQPQDDSVPPAPLAAPPSVSLTENLALAPGLCPGIDVPWVPVEPMSAAGTGKPLPGLPLYRQHCALLL